ncbi:MAG: hypothetical protein ACLGHP_10805, partial [Vicinamibacteria bacterium]
MKVVHVTAYFAPAAGFGGPPRSLLALCQSQMEAGVDVEVFTTTASRGRALDARPYGVDVEGVRVPLGETTYAGAAYRSGRPRLVEDISDVPVTGRLHV